MPSTRCTGPAGAFKFVWMIPMYQNPLGFTVSEPCRRALLAVAQRWDVPILENESYADFRIDGDPLPPALAGLSDGGDVIMYPPSPSCWAAACG